MNLLQTAAILELQRSNVNVLEVTLRRKRCFQATSLSQRWVE
jgi:hypothetical protein